MLEWYAKSGVCYVYAKDCINFSLRSRKDDFVSWYSGPETLEEEIMSGMSLCIAAQLRSCKWLTRGWILQELIAPEHISFLDPNGAHCPTNLKFSMYFMILLES